ncbi:hypothetical protein HY250_01665 [Candidatus Azambacteria bacterium]|nr:hypothetical protein [Candidatus Azambacteria bacterium]MBI3685088.1 hypothetical protein [Candidatus Azambacteria bacterium]
MDYKLKRQLIFGSGFIFVLVLLLAVAYQSFKPQVSCTDGVRNQGEQKVDCGGPCAACKETRLRDVEVLSHNLLKADSVYDAVAQVRNPNPAHGARSLVYVFHFYDEKKNMIGERSGSVYLLAGQTRYIVESNIALSQQAAFEAFSITGTVAWEIQERLTGQAALPVFSKKFEKISPPGIGFAKVTGTVENQTQYTFSAVDVQVVLVDKNQQPIAAGRTQINNLRFGESRALTVLFPSEIPLPVDVYAEAVTNVFDDSNIR